MFRKILLALVVLLVVFVVVVALQPADFKYSRSTTISAPPATVFPLVNELRQWEAWSPWQGVDPQMKVTYTGPAAGVGACYAWAGNSTVGEGRYTITESQPNERILFKLEFLKPFAATSEAGFTFKSLGSQTEVTWAMSGKNGFISKAFGLFMDCDKMVGADFEKGLSNLKKQAEGQARPW